MPPIRPGLGLKKLSESLPRNMSKNPENPSLVIKIAWGRDSVVKHVVSMCEALDSVTSKCGVKAADTVLPG